MKREKGEGGGRRREGGEESVVTVLMQGLSGNHVIALHDNNKG